MSQKSSRHLVDPELLPFLEFLPTRDLSDDNLAEMRAGGIALPLDPEVDAKVSSQRVTVPGPFGAPDVEIICYRPIDATGALPCIFHIHGGGFVGGTTGAQVGPHKTYALELNCAIVTVEYRLAPETRFPGAVEDCYAALKWLHANPGIPGVDLTRAGVMGESAGGGLAAALALLVRDRGEIRLAFQHLIYPMLDDRTSMAPDDQIHPYAGEYLWHHHNNRYGWSALLGHAPGGDGVSPYAAPARAETLEGLPPTFISTGSLDLFLEEDIDYARRLMRAGVPTELHVYPGGFHAFDWAPGVDVSLRAQRDSKAALRRALHPKPVR
jgi:acetyl esterase/lipase